MIEKAICNALASQKKITLPDFGTFIISWKSASFSEADTQLNPPQEEISFEYGIENGESIIDYLVKNYGFERNVIDASLQEFLENKNHDLESTGSFDIEGLGSFSQNEEGTFDFEKSEGYSIEYPILNIEKVEAVSLEEEQYDENADEDEIDEEEKERKRVMTPLLVAIPVIIIAVIAAWIFLDKDAYKKFFGEKSKTEIAQENTEDLSESTDLSSEEEDLEESVDNTTIEENDNQINDVAETKTSNKNSTSSKSVSTNTGSYHVIIGSFNSLQSAEKRKSELTKSGYSPKILENGSRYRLSVSSFANQATAKAKAKSLQNAFPGAWVLKY